MLVQAVDRGRPLLRHLPARGRRDDTRTSRFGSDSSVSVPDCTMHKSIVKPSGESDRCGSADIDVIARNKGGKGQESPGWETNSTRTRADTSKETRAKAKANTVTPIPSVQRSVQKVAAVVEDTCERSAPKLSAITTKQPTMSSKCRTKVTKPFTYVMTSATHKRTKKANCMVKTLTGYCWAQIVDAQDKPCDYIMVDVCPSETQNPYIYTRSEVEVHARRATCHTARTWANARSRTKCHFVARRCLCPLFLVGRPPLFRETSCETNGAMSSAP